MMFKLLAFPGVPIVERGVQMVKSLLINRTWEKRGTREHARPYGSARDQLVLFHSSKSSYSRSQTFLQQKYCSQSLQ